MSVKKPRREAISDLESIYELNKDELKYINTEYSVFTKKKNNTLSLSDFKNRVILENEAMKIGRTYKSIKTVSRRWKISEKDALELCKNFEERQNKNKN